MDPTFPIAPYYIREGANRLKIRRKWIQLFQEHRIVSERELIG